MAKTIRPTEPTSPRLRDTSSAHPCIDPESVVSGLGADVGERIQTLLSPISLLAVRKELADRLQTSGGRPALSDTTRRTKIPLREHDWAALEQLAAAVGSEGFVPSAGQVASVLLTLSVRQMMNDLAKNPSELNEFAARANPPGGHEQSS